MCSAWFESINARSRGRRPHWAARGIRALPRKDAKTVPILAMSADVFSDDIQRCLSSGMNGHVPKPIEPAALYRALLEAMAHDSGHGQDPL